MPIGSLGSISGKFYLVSSFFYTYFAGGLVGEAVGLAIGFAVEGFATTSLAAGFAATGFLDSSFTG